MRTPINRIEVIAGIFTLVLLGALAAFLLRSTIRESDDLLLAMHLDKTYGIAGGSLIKINDLPVGKVLSVGFEVLPGREDTPVKVTLGVEQSYRRWVRRGTRATIAPSLIPGLGSSEIHLDFLTHGELLQPGEELEAERPKGLIEEYKNIPEQLRALIEPALKSVQEMVSNANRITRDVADQQGFVGSLIADPVLRDDVKTMISSVKVFFTDIKESTPAILEAIENLTRMSGEANTMVVGLGDSVDTLTKALERVAPQTDRLGPMLDEAEATLKSARRAMADMEHIGGSTRGLIDSELTRILKNLDRASADLPELARKVDATLANVDRIMTALKRNVLIRGYLPAARPPRTEEVLLPRGGRRD